MQKKYLIGLFGKYINIHKFEKVFKNIFKSCQFYYLAEYENYNKLTSKKLDIIISYGYGIILKDDFFEKNPNCKIINMHLGYLPHGRGIYPNLFSIIKNKKCGYSIHLIENNKIDNGPLLFRKEVSFNNKDTLKTLFNKTKSELDSFIFNNLKKIIYKRKKKFFKRDYVYNNRSKANFYFKKLPLGWNTSLKTLKTIKF